MCTADLEADSAAWRRRKIITIDLVQPEEEEEGTRRGRGGIYVCVWVGVFVCVCAFAIACLRVCVRVCDYNVLSVVA